jgi:hypothetical protein
MKKLLMVTMIALTSLTSFGQDRVNRQKLSFEQSSEVLTNSTGWAYNTELGEWIDYTNVICKEKSYKTTYATLNGSDYMKSEHQSFNTIQIKTITFNNIKYYVLIINNIHGRYKYPSIRQDWRTYKFVESYVITESEYVKLKTLKEVKIERVVNYDLEYEDFNETILLDKIQSSLSDKSSILYDDYIFPIYESTDGNVRFVLPKSSKFFKGQKIGSVYIEPLYDIKNKTYFETSKIEFNKLILQ